MKAKYSKRDFQVAYSWMFAATMKKGAEVYKSATPEESAKVRAFLENMGYMLESVNLEKLMETAFEKRDFYRLPCDQYGQPCGNIETHSLTVGEYACKKRADREALTALWFDDYAVASWRADN